MAATTINWARTELYMAIAVRDVCIPGLFWRPNERGFICFIPGEKHDAERLAFAYGFGLSLQAYRQKNNLFPGAFTTPFEESLQDFKTQLATTRQKPSITKAQRFGGDFALMRINYTNQYHSDPDVMNAFLYTEMRLVAASRTNLVKSYQLSHDQA